MIGQVKLVGKTCPVCGKVFEPTPPLRPNVTDREFYGGRVKFFKEVTCDCRAVYDLCIERRFSYGEDKLMVIDMIEKQKGTPLAQIKREEEERLYREAEVKAIEAVHTAVQEGGSLPTLKQREEIKRQTVLATIPDTEAKIATLTTFTTKELRAMCRHRKIKFYVTESKQELAKKLLAADPSLVVAHE